MDEIKMFKVDVSGVLMVQAADASDAQNKAKEWIEANAGKLTLVFAEYTGLVELQS